MQAVTHAWVCMLTHTHRSSTLPVLGVFVWECNQGYPLMVFIHRSESSVCVCVCVFQGEHSVLFAVSEEAAVLWEETPFMSTHQPSGCESGHQ